MQKKRLVSSGISRLDTHLGGLFIGDNVVWYDNAGSLAWSFSQNFLKSSQAEAKPIIYISFDRSPKALVEKLGPLADYPYLTILDCFTNGKGGGYSIFSRFYEGETGLACRVLEVREPKDVDRVTDLLYEVHSGLEDDVRLIFESLTGMQELWGGEENLIRFYSHSCPRLYELETVAYWIMEKNAHSSRLKAQITQIAQVVIDLSIKRGITSLTVLKAESRDTANIQRPHNYWAKDMDVNFDPERHVAGGLDLGLRVKDFRKKAGLSQTELAKLVGVTPSTISQVEGNLIYPSLPALLKMAEVLSVGVSTFFEGKEQPRHRPVFSAKDFVNMRLPGLRKENGRAVRLTPIDFSHKAEPYLIEIYPNQNLPSHFFFHKGEEFGYLISGRLELQMDAELIELNSGDLIYLTQETPAQWRNPGQEAARLVWVKIRQPR